MMRRPVLSRLVSLAALAGLSAGATGCAGMAKALGLNKNPPDEFAIVTKAPLVVPPDFALRPPRPGEQRPQETATNERARLALFGVETAGVAADGQPSPGEQELMRQAGVLSADPNIRALIDNEAGGVASKSEGFANQIIFWRTRNGEVDYSEAPLVVDNPEEWLQSRRETIANVVGEDAQVKINKSGVLNLPGVR